MGGKTQTTTQSTQPFSPAIPGIQTGIKDAQKLYQSGVGGSVYTGSTVTPYSEPTTTAQGWDQNVAKDAYSTFTDNWNRLQPQVSDGGLNELQTGAVDRLRPIASGEWLTNNPYLEDMISMTGRDMADAINMSASGAGRYGSGAHQDLLARNIGDMASTMRFNNYGLERGYMDAANTALFNAGQQQKANQFGYTDVLGNAASLRTLPGQIMRDVGAEYEDLYSRQLADRVRIFDELQAAPWSQLARYNAIMSGAGQLGSTGTATSQQGGGLGEVAGGLLGLLSLL